MSILRSKTYIEDLLYTVENIKLFSLLNNKSILITGATGLICSAVVDLILTANAYYDCDIDVVLAVRNKEKALLRFGDYPIDVSKHISLIDYDATKSNNIVCSVDYIIHGASNAHPKAFVQAPVDTMISNICGTDELLRYANNNKIHKMIFISSSEVYGRIESLNPIEEDEYGYVDIVNSRNAYASSKRAGETLCASYYKQYGVKTGIVRPGHIYGPTASADDSRVGSSFAYSAANNNDIILKSAGTQLRSYCYVLDCASAILTVLLKGEPAGVYNISNPNSIISIRDIARLYAEAGDVNLKYDIPTNAEVSTFNPMDNSSLDSTKLQALGWRALFDAFVGTKHTISILRELLYVR